MTAIADSLLSHRTKTMVVSEDESLQCSCAIKELFIRQQRRAIFLCGDDVGTFDAKLFRDGTRDVHIHVKLDRHYRHSAHSQFPKAADKWRDGFVCSKLIVLLHFSFDLRIDLDLMVKVIGHRGIGFRELEMRKLSAHFLGRVAVRQISRCDHRYPNTRKASKVRRFFTYDFDMRVHGSC